MLGQVQVNRQTKKKVFIDKKNGILLSLSKNNPLQAKDQ